MEYKYKLVDRVAEHEYQNNVLKLFRNFKETVILPITVVSSIYGPGKITDIQGTSVLTAHLYTTFDSGVQKIFSFGKTTHLTFPDKNIAVVFETFASSAKELDTSWEEYCKDYEAKYLAAQEQRRLDEERKRQEQKNLEEFEKQERRYNEHKERMLQNFSTYNTSRARLDVEGNFWYTLGWLAKYVSTISATIPDYLNDLFTKNFGSEAPRHLVDSKKKTTGGYSMKWDWSFAMTIKKNHSRIPTYLMTYISESATRISNTAFIWALVVDYGFQFGKEQDIDLIRSNIPAEYLESFEQGFES